MPGRLAAVRARVLGSCLSQGLRRTLIRWAKLRWRIEHDYREVKTGLGLDHYEGRTWQGWHHHVTLISAAHAFLTLQRLNPKPSAGMTLYVVLRRLQELLVYLIGTCPTCKPASRINNEDTATIMTMHYLAINVCRVDVTLVHLSYA